jgi:NAD(P)-dependent dehydrogenase (short-subunit alcohol dehydrogenase family)
VSAERVLAAIVCDGNPLAADLAEALGTAVTTIAPAELAEPPAPTLVDADADRVVWIHLVPTGHGGHRAALGEAETLLRSASSARASAAACGAELTFVGLLPAQGLYTGAAGLACDLGRASMRGLIENGIAQWSAAGARIAGVVYGGLEGHGGEGRRPAEELRQRTPMGRPGTVAELADAVRYLGSRSAGYVTGTFLHVDGGWRAYSWIYPARTI